MITVHHIYNPWVPPIAISDWGGRPDNIYIVADSPVGSAKSHQPYGLALTPADCDMRYGPDPTYV